MSPSRRFIIAQLPILEWSDALRTVRLTRVGRFQVMVLDPVFSMFRDIQCRRVVYVDELGFHFICFHGYWICQELRQFTTFHEV